VPSTFDVDRMVHIGTIVHVTRIDSPPTASDRERIEAIIAQMRAGLRELRCVASERLVRLGISMSHLHLMSMLERQGQMPMSRVAELLGFSLSNATGLIDRMEERGLVERIRVPDDRRLVLVRVTDRGREVLNDADVLRDDLIENILLRLDGPQLERVAAVVSDLGEAIGSAMRDGSLVERLEPGTATLTARPDAVERARA
jgi:DNA-binding MarR family transcriptional regulator